MRGISAEKSLRLTTLRLYLLLNCISDFHHLAKFPVGLTLSVQYLNIYLKSFIKSHSFKNSQESNFMR